MLSIFSLHHECSIIIICIFILTYRKQTSNDFISNWMTLMNGTKSQVHNLIDLIRIRFTLAMQPCEKGGKITYISQGPQMHIECFSCTVKLLCTSFIKIIRAYGALIISVIPGTCNGDSVFSLLFFKPKCEEHISQKLNLALYFVPILHFNLKGWRKWKGSLKPCEIRKTRDEGNKMVEWESEELWAFLICPSPAILLMTCYFWINRNEETCSSVIFQAW